MLRRKAGQRVSLDRWWPKRQPTGLCQGTHDARQEKAGHGVGVCLVAARIGYTAIRRGSKCPIVEICGEDADGI